MKTFLAGAAGAMLALGTAGAANAAIIVQDNQLLDYKVYNTNDPDGNVLHLETQKGNDPSNLVVKYQAGANQVIRQAGNGGGFAWVGAADNSFFNQITFTPDSGFSGFTAFAFNLEFSNRDYGPDYGIEFDLTYLDNTTEHFSLVGDWGQPAKFLITAEGTEVIKSIKVFNFSAHEVGGGPPDSRPLIPAPLPFGAIKQASFNAAGVVPEPATWALMIAGFGGAGVMLRRRRAVLA